MPSMLCITIPPGHKPEEERNHQFSRIKEGFKDAVPPWQRREIASLHFDVLKDFVTFMRTYWVTTPPLPSELPCFVVI